MNQIAVRHLALDQLVSVLRQVRLSIVEAELDDDRRRDVPSAEIFDRATGQQSRGQDGQVEVPRRVSGDGTVSGHSLWIGWVSVPSASGSSFLKR
jgi:hypothetical protein